MDKKHADDSRTEFKASMKTAEEARQTAELSKKGVERRLMAVRELPIRRVTALEDELGEMQNQMADDESRVLKSGIEASANEQEITKRIRDRKRELELAGDAADALGKRVPELEEAIDKAERMRTEAQERLRFHQRRPNRLSSGRAVRDRRGNIMGLTSVNPG